jgi:hypothetical protein
VNRICEVHCRRRKQREERENGHESRKAGSTTESEKCFVSRGFSGNAPTAQKAHDCQSWRRDRDSNPGYACAHNGFRDRPVQPLRHPSTGDVVRQPFEPMQGSGRRNHWRQQHRWMALGRFSGTSRAWKVPTFRWLCLGLRQRASASAENSIRAQARRAGRPPTNVFRWRAPACGCGQARGRNRILRLGHAVAGTGRRRSG